MTQSSRNGLLRRIRAGSVKVAFGSRLKGLPNVITLGVRPNLEDYSPDEWSWIKAAPTLYYATPFLAQQLQAMGKHLFPGMASYHYAGDKIRQTTLFKLLEIPHPRTRLYYRNHFSDILRDFDMPFVAKIPRSSDSGRGVFLIRTEEDLDDYLKRTPVGYVQEYIPSPEDYRVVLIGYKVILGYRRLSAEGEFRGNVARGAAIQLHGVPPSVIDLAYDTARMCGFEDVGIDIISDGCNDYVLEANFRYGRKGFKQAGMDYKGILRDMLERGEI